MNRPVKIAVVGSGGIAETHLAAIAALPDVALSAICSRNIARAKELASPFHARVFDSLEQMLAEKTIDAVLIATPSGVHGEAAISAMRSGRHVLCEKPLEISTERIRQMITEADKANVLLAGFFPLRCGAGAITLRKAVQDGRFGQLTFASVRIKWWRDQEYYEKSSWRGRLDMDGGGALMNQGIHAVDLLQWIAGIPSEVSAFAGTLAHPGLEVEDTLSAAIRLPCGALGTIEAATSCYPGLEISLEISGDQGTAILVNDRITDWRFKDTRLEDDAVKKIGGEIGGGSADPKAISSEGHRRQIEAFCKKIRGQAAEVIDGREAGKAVAIIEAIYLSVRTKKVENVHVP